MLEENSVSSGKEMLVFHINDNTEISVKCIGSVVGRLKDIIKYHTVVKVISAEFVNISLESWLLLCKIFMWCFGNGVDLFWDNIAYPS